MKHSFVTPMPRLVLTLAFVAATGFTATAACFAQAHEGMVMGKQPAKPSTSLTVTNLAGASKTWTTEDFKSLPHITVQVHNAHNNQDEAYSGVAVSELIEKAGNGPANNPDAVNVSPNMRVIVAAATDNFHVAITACDTHPTCRSGQAIVADQLNNAPLTTDGAFKLVLTEDKKPARWARNLQSLTEIAVPAK